MGMTGAELASDVGMTVTQDPLELTMVPHLADRPEGWGKQRGPGETDSYSHEGFPCSQELFGQPHFSSCGTLFLSHTFARALV
jgi:hypothetical protein